jgi:hypothetical protein
LNKCIADEDCLYLGLMNGVLLSMRFNLKKKELKTIHSAAIVEVKKGHFGESVITLGKDKLLKIVNTNTFGVEYFLDVEDGVFTFETDEKGNIYYIDTNTKDLKIVSLKLG